jgi:hypothetical protein
MAVEAAGEISALINNACSRWRAENSGYED